MGIEPPAKILETQSFLGPGKVRSDNFQSKFVPIICGTSGQKRNAETGKVTNLSTQETQGESQTQIIPDQKNCHSCSRTNVCLYSHGDSSGYSLFWWFLECLPFGTAAEKHGLWRTQWKPNWGHRRNIESSVLIHWTVFYRIHVISLYCPMNLPFEIGPFLVRLLKQVLTVDEETAHYLELLDVRTIKTSTHPIWQALENMKKVSSNKHENEEHK